jgi:hypothetical protein
MLGRTISADGGGNCGRDCADIIAGNTSNPATNLAANTIRLEYCIPTPELRLPAIAFVLILCTFTVKLKTSG